jgi:hypothetical protein
VAPRRHRQRAAPDVVAETLTATDGITFATGIVSISLARSDALAAGHAALGRRFSATILLGVGVSHAPLVDRSTGRAQGAPDGDEPV